MSLLKIVSLEKLSKQQQAFNQHIDLIAKQQKELAKLKRRIEQGQTFIAQHIVPVERAYHQLKRTFAMDLMPWMNHPKLSDSENHRLTRLIKSIVDEIRPAFPNDDALDRIIQQIQANSPADSHEIFGSEHEYANPKASKRTKAKPSHTPQSPVSDEMLQQDKHLKKIYVDLVKHLHPDREPNETLRLHKTEIMKEITRAYHQKNIYTLMQLHVSHLCNQHLKPATWDEKQVDNYLTLLRQQSTSLSQQIKQLKNHPHTGLIIDLMAGTETIQQQRLQAQIDYLQQRNTRFEDQMYVTSLDVKAFRKFLKTVELPQ